jgi:hypothetical protein
VREESEADMTTDELERALGRENIVRQGEIVKQVLENGVATSDREAWLAKLFYDADVVWAAYTDPLCLDRTGLHLVKGKSFVRACPSAAFARINGLINAIRVDFLHDALALETTFGDLQPPEARRTAERLGRDRLLTPKVGCLIGDVIDVVPGGTWISHFSQHDEAVECVKMANWNKDILLAVTPDLANHLLRTIFSHDLVIGTYPAGPDAVGMAIMKDASGEAGTTAMWTALALADLDACETLSALLGDRGPRLEDFERGIVH